MHKLSNYEREKAIYSYVIALDHGDLDCVAEVLELALCDQELERIIKEIDLVYQEEENLTPISTDAEIVKNLIQKHLHSTFKEVEENKPPSITKSYSEIKKQQITVGDVARRLQQTESLKTSEHELVASLINSSISLPSSLSIQATKKLFKEDLKQEANQRFLDKFRTTAIKLRMKRNHSNAQLAAARRQKKK